VSKKLKKAISILATFVGSFGGVSGAASAKASSSESENINTNMAALAVAGKHALKNSANSSRKNSESEDWVALLGDEDFDPSILDKLDEKYGEPSPAASFSESENINAKPTALTVEDKRDLKNSANFSSKNAESEDWAALLGDEDFDPSILDKLDEKYGVPSPAHVGALGFATKDGENKIAKDRVISSLSFKRKSNVSHEKDHNSKTNETIPISFIQDTSESAVERVKSAINSKQNVGESMERIYETSKPDFTFLLSCGLDESLISSFYNLQQDDLILKNNKQVLEYSNDSTLYREVSSKLDSNVDKLVKLIREQKNKLLSGDKIVVEKNIKKLVEYYHILNNTIKKCIQSLRDKDLSDRARSEIDAAIKEYNENPRMKLWWYKGKDNLCPISNIVAKLGEAKLILLYTDLLLTSVGSSENPEGYYLDDESENEVDRESAELKALITADDPFFNSKFINKVNKEQDEELFRDLVSELEEDV